MSDNALALTWRAAQTIATASTRTVAAGQAHVDAFVRDKLSAAATEEGLRVVAVAQAELAQRAVERWLELLYTDARFNLRSVDNQIRLAPPWSRSRRVNYHLTEPQARTLRWLVVEVLDALPARRRLFWYDAGATRWVLNRDRFPTLDTALAWQRGPGAITPAAWRAAQERYPAGRRRE